MMFCVFFVFFPYFVGFGRKEVNSINSSSKHMNCAKLLKIWPLCTILAITLSSKLGLRHGQVRWKEDSERNKSSSKSFFIQDALERPKWRSSAMARWRAGNERQARWRAVSHGTWRSSAQNWCSSVVVRWEPPKSAELIWKEGNPTPTQSWTS